MCILIIIEADHTVDCQYWCIATLLSCMSHIPAVAGGDGIKDVESGPSSGELSPSWTIILLYPLAMLVRMFCKDQLTKGGPATLTGVKAT